MKVCVWYLYHSGVAVETEKSFLVFDYWRDTPAGGLAAGVIDPKEIAVKNKKVIAFSSHNHPDHYNPVILGWPKQIPGAELVLSDDIPACPGALMVGQDREYDHAGIHIQTLVSTDEGVAFLLKADGLTIYHAGDLNWWHWAGEPGDFNEKMARDYKAQIDRLRGVKIDLAFLPVDPRLRGQYAWGADYLMRTAQVKQMVCIHFGDRPQAIEELIQDPVSQPYRDRILPLAERGQMAELTL
ncbi:MAG: MBL fold metallo-hydrolase [Oscillospiraceae bacterium]|nr:MBL fold metallo-hydrolase [Oscillospiraceae bacterium]